MSKQMDLTIVGESETKPKPKRGRGGSENFPNAQNLSKDEIVKEKVTKLLGEVLTEYRQERVRSDEELAQRLSDYFKRCAENGQIPTVEEMCMCTGYSQSTVWDWENGRNKGFSNSTSEIIKKAKDFLKTFDAKLVISGVQNPIVYFFRAKNYYGMRDQTEMVVTPGRQDFEGASPEELQQRYVDATIIDYEDAD